MSRQIPQIQPTIITNVEIRQILQNSEGVSSDKIQTAFRLLKEIKETKKNLLDSHGEYLLHTLFTMVVTTGVNFLFPQSFFMSLVMSTAISWMGAGCVKVKTQMDESSFIEIRYTGNWQERSIVNKVDLLIEDLTRMLSRLKEQLANAEKKSLLSIPGMTLPAGVVSKFIEGSWSLQNRALLQMTNTVFVYHLRELFNEKVCSDPYQDADVTKPVMELTPLAP